MSDPDIKTLAIIAWVLLSLSVWHYYYKTFKDHKPFKKNIAYMCLGGYFVIMIVLIVDPTLQIVQDTYVDCLKFITSLRE